MRRRVAGFDDTWKEVFREILPECLQRFFPPVAKAIDWSKRVEFLDKELRATLARSPRPRRFVDLLVRVRWKRGGSGRLLVHVEVQNQMDRGFPFRMLVYHVILLSRLGRPVLSLAVLADPNPEWRPDRFESGVEGMGLQFRFPICKLSDFTDEELEADPNPVNFVILAQRIAQRFRKDPMGRCRGKLGLMARLGRLARGRGYNRRICFLLTRAIDWSIHLREQEEELYETGLRKIEEETPMRLLGSREQWVLKKGWKEGRQEGVVRGWGEALKSLVSARFPDWQPSWNRHLEAVDDAARLEKWLQLGMKAPSGEAFLKAIGKKPR